MNYFTDFPSPPAPENPISEVGEWEESANAFLTPMRTVAGKAIATAQGLGEFDDSAALQTRVYTANVETRATVFRDPTLDTDATHECELLMRVTETATATEQYEYLFAFQGSVQGVRWVDEGSQGFAFLDDIAGTVSIGREFVTGDTIIGRIVGDCLEISAIGFDGTLFPNLGFFKDTNIAGAGRPGIGGFTRVADGGDPAKFCFTSVEISDEFEQELVFEDTFGRANESPLGAPYEGVPGADDLRLVSNQVAVITADTVSMMRYVGEVMTVDHWAEITIGVVGAGDFGVAICCQANGDALITADSGGGFLRVFKRIAGGFALADEVAIVLVATDRLRARRFGGDAIYSVNDVDVLTIEIIDPELIGGQPGMFMFDATSRISAFRCGNVSAVFPEPPPPVGGGGIEGIIQGVSIEGTIEGPGGITGSD